MYKICLHSSAKLIFPPELNGTFAKKSTKISRFWLLVNWKASTKTGIFFFGSLLIFAFCWNIMFIVYRNVWCVNLSATWRGFILYFMSSYREGWSWLILKNEISNFHSFFPNCLFCTFGIIHVGSAVCYARGLMGPSNWVGLQGLERVFRNMCGDPFSRRKLWLQKLWNFFNGEAAIT